LVMIYTAASPAAKYSIKCGQTVSVDQPMYSAWSQEGEVICSPAKIPFASGNGWEVDSDSLYFRGKVFAFFNASPPASKDQLLLL
jgi:hypothetical protein